MRFEVDAATRFPAFLLMERAGCCARFHEDQSPRATDAVKQPFSSCRWTLQAAPLAVHRDPNALALENLGEVFGGELDALVGVEDVRLPLARERLL
jgi:hypothetical protein